MPKLVDELRGARGVQGVHHVHVWAIDEQQNALEAHVVVDDAAGQEAEAIKNRIKALVGDRFGIAHTTLELERASTACEGGDAKVIGHHTADHRHEHGDHSDF